MKHVLNIIFSYGKFASSCLRARMITSELVEEISSLINKVYCADCLEFMKGLEDRSVDMVLTDPPYAIGWNSKKAKSFPHATRAYEGFTDWNWDKEKVSRKHFDEIVRVSKNQIIFGGQQYADYLKPNYGWIVWDKKTTGSLSDCELAYTSFLKSVRRFTWLWNGCFQQDMKNKEKRVYPTQKPLALMLWIVEKFTKPGELIVDPFCGSGPVLKAAQMLGRRFIGIDISEHACSIANNRLAQLSVLPPLEKGGIGGI